MTAYLRFGLGRICATITALGYPGSKVLMTRRRGAVLVVLWLADTLAQLQAGIAIWAAPPENYVLCLAFIALTLWLKQALAAKKSCNPLHPKRDSCDVLYWQEEGQFDAQHTGNLQIHKQDKSQFRPYLRRC